MRSCTTQPQTQQRPVRLSTVVPHRISRQRNVCKAANANGAGELKFGRARVRQREVAGSDLMLQLSLLKDMQKGCVRSI